MNEMFILSLLLHLFLWVLHKLAVFGTRSDDIGKNIRFVFRYVGVEIHVDFAEGPTFWWILNRESSWAVNGCGFVYDGASETLCFHIGAGAFSC
jgi:hypothetical protein